jgi:hypothetical protein
MLLVRRWPAKPASAAPEKGSAGADSPPPHPHQLHAIKADLILRGKSARELQPASQPSFWSVSAIYVAETDQKELI